MKILLFALFVGAVTCSPTIQKTPITPRNERHPVCDLVLEFDYPCEVHETITSDNYVLRLHRIPHGKKHPTATKGVVFIMHGILNSAADWVLTGEDHGLAFLLANEGYDVWMGNARGSSESRNNTQLDPSDSKFWEFSWHEIGTIDLPTMIDYTLEQTGETALLYVGHSQGTTSFYVMASTKPEYNAKIKAHFSLAPIAFMSHMTSPLLQIISFWNKPLGVLLDLIGINEFLPSNTFMEMVGGLLCSDDSITQFMCTNALFALCGFSSSEMNATILPFLTEYTPAGASTRQLLHYSQEISSGHFRQYDFGLFDNLNRYGSMSPPEYNLKAVTAPVYLFYSHNDWLAAEVDVEKLSSRLGNLQGKFLVSKTTFNHLDYLYAIHAPEYVYSKVVSLMTRYN